MAIQDQAYTPILEGWAKHIKGKQRGKKGYRIQFFPHMNMICFATER
jgi:hypothetical protein